MEHTNNITHLTEQMPLTNGGHILYCYDSLNSYIDNALAFIIKSVEQAHHVLVIDMPDHCDMLRNRLTSILPSSQQAVIQFMDSLTFDQLLNRMSSDQLLEHIYNITQPISMKRSAFRTWAHAEVWDPLAMEQRIIHFERITDAMPSGMQSITVCAYPAWKLSGTVQLQLMKHHEYLMTDREFVQSPLFANKATIFPSLSQQSELESEMNLFKQKLDFVHVISHEVRNPLTIMKAFATMVLAKEKQLSDYGKEKIKAISEYVDVIDNEINHIIYTEQMLSGEELWGLEQIEDALPLIQETVEFMCIKARSEGITLQTEVLTESPVPIRTSVIGLKLILSNLLSNAIKYSHEQAKVYLRIYTGARQLLIEVKDEGVGMDAGQVSRLFRKYGKMNFERSGQGIGLYMVKKLVDHLKGSIEVQSQPEQGTLILVKLPLAPG
ncbi:hypothetical protein DUZ99_11275 [Xylanibacillus composti]|uniref:histidine kinase n=1 Tax=Xylanibacillus composti TaxID=1572762 RepID=A0A8J4H1D8_9BACL|nr:ATP-binding protein [Xylanibacillus composti]MDT9725552.1 hypothetical protein [Xylanibacillus composti]GIQ67646.1 hypothetical protein XYCOK13_04700 [Xylanibacillus composti]